MKKQISEVKTKREFSELPESVVKRALKVAKGDVKVARGLLRKYFGVFLTNKILKGKLGVGVLKKHLSTRNRDYEEVYGKVFGVWEENAHLVVPTSPPIVKGLVKEGGKQKVIKMTTKIETIIDLGCGVNGFSYGFLPKGIDYVGVEAVGQLVKQTNNYFKDNGFDKIAKVVHGDLFELDKVLGLIRKTKKPRVVFMFQVVDALEFFKRDFSKRFLEKIAGECEYVVVSWGLRSLSGKEKFGVSRGWLVGFIEKNFEILNNFKIKNEKFLIFKNKN